jgi:hypothetical protein
MIRIAMEVRKMDFIGIMKSKLFPDRCKIILKTCDEYS